MPKGAIADDKEVLLGRTVYSSNCAACHGANREGLVGPALTPTTLTQADEFYHDTIKNGRQGTAMPPWGGMLNDTDIDVLVHFLKTVEP